MLYAKFWSPELSGEAFASFAPSESEPQAPHRESTFHSCLFVYGAPGWSRLIFTSHEALLIVYDMSSCSLQT